jgi:hypothetical protein
MIKNSIIFLIIGYLTLFVTNYLVPKVLIIIKKNTVEKYTYQNYYTHEEIPINVQEIYPPQKTVFYLNGVRSDIKINIGPGSNYPYRKNLLDKLGFFPLSGLSHSKISVCNELGYWPILKTDRFGNNNKIEIEEAKVLIFGDSFGEAACVNQESSIQSVMTKNRLPTYSFSNGGISLPITAASFFEHIDLAKNADTVIYLYYINDTGRGSQSLRKEIQNPYINAYLKDGYRQPNYINKYLSKNTQQEMQNYSEKKITETSALSWATRNSDPPTFAYSLVNSLKLNWYIFMLYETHILDLDKLERKVIKNLLSRMKKVAETSGKQFLVASIPVCKDENNNQINKVLPGLAKNVEDIAIKLDIKIIDLSGAFVDCSQYIRHRPNIMNSPSGVHFDENGYQLIAKALHKALQQLSY